MSARRFSLIDQVCLGVDQAMRAILNNPKTTARCYPADSLQDGGLTDAQRKHSAALMRINHAGEVCAQALYYGQGLTSRQPKVQQQMQQAAIEEGDHLAWCQSRLFELGSHTSYLNPFWYAGSFSIGLIAGLVGDRWSLGFLAETEKQVVEHLESHLLHIAPEDQRSSAILRQMQCDEAEHRDAAIDAGAATLPDLAKRLMRMTSKIMVKVAYWI